MEVIGKPPLYLLKNAKRKKKFFLDGNIPIKYITKKGKFRKPGSMSIESILKTDDL